MSISSPLNNLYVDQYFPTEPTQPLGNEMPSDGSYESFEDDFLGGGDMEVVEDSANSGVLEGDPEVEEEMLEPTALQKSTMEWLDEHGQDLEEDFFAAQERLAELLDGVEEMKPEKRKEKLEEVESTLD
ncbi:MAG TPA: hypothetical protein VJP40_03140, partial [bacterium]|nr:hypothetical protein [bacterium]